MIVLRVPGVSIQNQMHYMDHLDGVMMGGGERGLGITLECTDTPTRLNQYSLDSQDSLECMRIAPLVLQSEHTV